MSRLLRQFTAFLRAEEVPRWFGLSLVLIYLVGLATVANLGLAQSRRAGSETIRDAARYTLERAADRIGGLATDDTEWFVQRVRQELRDLSGALPVETIQLIENGRVLASLSAEDEGVPLTGPGAEVAPIETELSSLGGAIGGPTGWRFRVPVATLPSQGGGDAGVETSSVAASNAVSDPTSTTSDRKGSVSRYLLAAVSSHRPSPNSLTAHAGALSIVLVVLGALLVTYRCAREQMRGVARIANRLQSHGDHIREELSSLRIADAAALDKVTTAWNELVELTQTLSTQVQQNEANAELTRVLRNSPGSALAEALHALPDGVVHIAGEGRIEYANATACRFLNWNAREAAGSNLPDPSGDDAPSRLVKVVRGALQPDGSFQPCNEVVETPAAEDGSTSSLRVWVIPIRKQREAGGCVVVIRDVSQQLRADKAREEFITQVTHELRTPLTNIRAYAETLSSGMFDDPKVITECYNVITKETRRLSRLIEDVLSVSQLEVGSIELSLDNVDLKTLLTEAVRDVRGLAEEKQIDLQLVLPAKLEPIRGDKDKLAVVVNNLLGNAIKYTPGEGTVLLGCQVGQHEVMITVKDNGIGIEPAEQAKVFEKFQRGSNPEVRQETGTGIGLFTAREIARRHGGDIELISEVGAGSTFMVRLPQRANRATSMSSSVETPQKGS